MVSAAHLLRTAAVIALLGLAAPGIGPAVAYAQVDPGSPAPGSSDSSSTPSVSGSPEGPPVTSCGCPSLVGLVAGTGDPPQSQPPRHGSRHNPYYPPKKLPTISTPISVQTNRGTLQPTTPPPATPVQPTTPAVAAPQPRYTPAAPDAVIETVPVVSPPPVVAPVAIPKPPVAPALPAPAQGFHVALTSFVGAGTQALTLVLVFLVTGAWFFGNRISSQFSLRRRTHVHVSA